LVAPIHVAPTATEAAMMWVRRDAMGSSNSL
jgi:hypothetical protein